MTGTTVTPVVPETPNAPIAFTAAPERLADTIGEFVALLHAAYPEGITVGVGNPPRLDPFKVPVAVDAGTYLAAEAAGVVSFVALRDAAGTMVGAAVTLIARDPSTSIPTATTDKFHLMPEVMEQGGADVLVDAVMADAEARGALRWIVGQAFDSAPVKMAGRGLFPVASYSAVSLHGAPPC